MYVCVKLNNTIKKKMDINFILIFAVTRNIS